MEIGFGQRLKHAWDVFKDPIAPYQNLGTSYSYRPDRPRMAFGNDQTILTALYNRIALDVAAIDIEHVKMDDENRYLETIDSTLNTCLTLEANIDQTGTALVQDIVMSMLDEGVVAVVPSMTSNNIKNGPFKILSLRTAKIIHWYPKHVRVLMYNEEKGKKEEIVLPKSFVAIIENPFYAVCNAPNSTMQRLKRKLSLLDMTDEKNSSGKLDLIIQLPYVVKTETRQKQALQRMQDIESQLIGSTYGIAYTDGTEKITQLNRPVDNNLMTQVESLTSMLYSQLSMSKEILEGTASADVMQNYYNRNIKVFLEAIVDEMKRKFLTKTARSQKQSIMYFKDPFELLSMAQLADIGDKFARNEILTANEIRQGIGVKPSTNPNADELRNKNLYPTEEPMPEDYPLDEEDPAMLEENPYYDEEDPYYE